jgi:UDP-glucose 4-epimerase
MGVEPRISLLDARSEVQHAYSSHEKVKRYFGDLVRNVPLDQGVSRMAAWAKKTGIRQGQTFDAVEVKQNMPPSWLALIKP